MMMCNLRYGVGQPRRDGAIVALLAILLPVLLVLSAISINISYMELTRTELQIATDASCRAAGRTLARTGSQQESILAAQEAGVRNTVAGRPLTIASDDLVFGSATREGDGSKYLFQANVTPFNAVRIRADSLMSAGESFKFPIHMGTSGVDFRPVQLATCSQVELDLCLIVDRSGSMAWGSDEVCNPLVPPMRAPPGWTFGQPVPPLSRWSEAIASVDAFLNVLSASPQNEQVALVTYNHGSYSELNLSSGYSLIPARLNSYSAAYEAGGTNIGDGIIEGINTLSNSPAKRDWAVKVAIVLSDGIHNWGTSPIDAAYNAAAQNVVLHTVTFSNEADQNLMHQVASIGSGKHFHATNLPELIDAFESIARSLPLLLTE